MTKVQMKHTQTMLANRGRFQGDLPERTFEYGALVLELVDQIPPGTKGWHIAKQLARSGTSVGANACEADEALTDAEFIYRCGVARKEAKETDFWLRMCCRSRLLAEQAVRALIQESHELVCIFTSVLKRTQVRKERESK